METVPQPPPTLPQPDDFEDRSGALLAVGILMVGAGLLCGALLLLAIGVTVMAGTGFFPANTMTLRSLGPAALFYGGLGGGLICLGFGVIKARRWARTLSLALAWTWLMSAAAGLAAMLFILPTSLSQVSQPPGAPNFTAILAPVMSLIFLVLIVIPAGMIWFFRGPHVRLTCELNDPSVPWTDRVPMPVLLLTLWLGFASLVLLSLPITSNSTLPFFGSFLHGLPGTCVILVVTAILVWCALAVYRVKRVGINVVTALFLVVAVSSLITFSARDLNEMYQAMGYSAEELEQAKVASTYFSSQAMTLTQLFPSVLLLGFLIWVRRYFPAQSRQAAPAA